ncbi:Myosin heavy chain IB [Phytophthora nicotianae]|nr:Myosin heavy chain IB [Phytophthora nicotianae]
MRTPPREQQRAKQHASPKQAARPASNNGAEPSGGTVYTGRNTYERVAQFAQLAAFEAPPPPPPRPQKPIKPVPVSDPVPKNARAPPPPRPPAPKRPAFHIPDDPLPTDYDILSPKTARSLAPSVASSATTVVAPGRNRPTPLQQNRRPQYTNAAPSYYQSGYSRDDNNYAESTGFDDSRFDESKYDESNYGDSRYDESSYESNKFKGTNNYDDSFVSEVSSMAWSGASGLSDDSYYHAAPSNTARIPVIEAPRDDDDDHSEDGYSDWGHSTQHSSDAFRSTAGSDASFFSVNSDFADSKNVFKEREF